MRAAEATAQDGAFAFILVLDYAVRRLGRLLPGIDKRTVGTTVMNGVKLNNAIWALANQARHADEWMAMKSQDLQAQPSAAVIMTLGYDPQNLNAAREFVCALPIYTYLDLEEMLLISARELLNGTGWHLGLLTAGAWRLDPDVPSV